MLLVTREEVTDSQIGDVAGRVHDSEAARGWGRSRERPVACRATTSPSPSPLDGAVTARRRDHRAPAMRYWRIMVMKALAITELNAACCFSVIHTLIGPPHRTGSRHLARTSV